MLAWTCFFVGHVCSSSAPGLRLVKTTFTSGLDMTGRGPLLVYLDTTSAVVSRISVISLVASNSPLFTSVNSLVTVKKCFLDGIRNSFGHFSGGSVYVHSSSFSNSPRPITMDTWPLPQPDTTTSERVSFVTEGLTLDRVHFNKVQGKSDGAEGGAVWFSSPSEKKLSITGCTFTECRAGDGVKRWGDAVYCIGAHPDFTFTGCTVTTTSNNPGYSVVHFQCGRTPGEYGKLTLVGNHFETCSVKQYESKTEGGGSGLVIRFPTTLEFIGCVFSDCSTPLNGGALFFEKKTTSQSGQTFLFDNCTFENTRATNNGGAISLPNASTKVTISNCVFGDNSGDDRQTGNGGFLHFGDDPGTLEISNTEFKNSAAADGGCIFAAVAVTAFSIDNVTVDACGGRGGTNKACIVVKSSKTVLEGLHLLNMEGGNGRLALGSNFESGMITFSGCTFEKWGTEQLFAYELSGNEFALNLTNCNFTDVTSSSDSNFIRLKIDGSGSKIRDLYLVDCNFTSVQAAWSLAVQKRSGTTGKCVVERCLFDNVVVYKEGTEKSNAEVLLDLESFSNVAVSNTIFSNIDGYNGLLLIEAQTCSIDSVCFEHCTLRRPGNPDTGETVYSCLSIAAITAIGTVTVETFNDCRFVSCSDTNGLPLCSISAVIEDLSGLELSACTFQTNPVKITPTGGTSRIAFANSRFERLQSTSAPVRIESVTTIAFSSTSFSQVTDATNLIGLTGTPALELTHVHINECSFGKLGAATSLLLEQCEFRHNRISKSLAALSGQSAKVLDCQFENCTSQQSLLSLSQCRTVDISLTTFQECRSETSSLLVLQDVQSFVLNRTCFQGGEQAPDHPAYINCSCDNGIIELPVCFDKSKDASVRLNGDFGEIPNIFDCHDCSFIPTPEPEITSESEEVSDITSVDQEDETTTQEDDTTTQEGPTDAPAEADKSGLGGGAIAGIVIGVLVLIAACVLLILFLLFRKRSNRSEKTQEDEEMAEEAPDETITSVMTGDEWIAKVTEDAATTTGGTMDGLYLETFEEIDY